MRRGRQHDGNSINMEEKRMVKFEIKKVFCRTSARIALLLLLAVLGVTCFLTIDVSYINENGDRESGSPPPMRGTPRFPVPHKPSDRITPAHAGNTNRQRCSVLPRQDHPRPCGEHFCAMAAELTYPGSPPPMRGTLGQWVKHPLPFRITPAHAGNTKVVE